MRIGIDLGGTKIEGVVLGVDGSEKARRRVATPRDSYDGIVRAGAVLFALAACGVIAACGNDASRPMDCTEGEMRECYGGPAGTENVGPCRTGLEICRQEVIAVVRR